MIKRLKEAEASKPKEDMEDLNNGIAEEISWALEEKARASEETKEKKENHLSPSSKSGGYDQKKESKEEKFSVANLKSVRESNLNKPLSIREKIEQQKKKEEERLKKFQEEKNRILNKRSGASDSPTSEQSPVTQQTSEPLSSKSINGVEIIGNRGEHGGNDTNSLPRWKREKLDREKSKAGPQTPAEEGSKTKDAEETKPSSELSALSTEITPSKTLAPASPSSEDPELKNLPRWKREKILR